ncbi:MAG: hypothetical protein LBR67_06125 [Dysgonamonadaceae bacterium]|jgi:hypothetical protein|nr:hypothetical protein [Dysgonamonadaceae bacterium]
MQERGAFLLYSDVLSSSVILSLKNAASAVNVRSVIWVFPSFPAIAPLLLIIFLQISRSSRKIGVDIERPLNEKRGKIERYDAVKSKAPALQQAMTLAFSDVVVWTLRRAED